MIAEPYIPWEDRPACWSWDPPLLPQPNRRGRLEAWQDGRCAICGATGGVLFDDHDHDTGDTRGYLCPSCNGLEGISPGPSMRTTEGGRLWQSSGFSCATKWMVIL